MRNALAAAADRLVGLVVPRTNADACECEQEVVYVCQGGAVFHCQLSCRCEYINCFPVGHC